jgi:hypothetical protein
MATVYIGKQGCFKYAFRDNMRVQCISAFRNSDGGFLDRGMVVARVKSSRELMNMLKRISRSPEDYDIKGDRWEGRAFRSENGVGDLMDVVNKNMQRKEK